MPKRSISYLVDMIAQLEGMASAGGYARLARILRFALNEARRQRDAE
jgi:hypothetical protein